jgi:hypothetical protein
MSPSTFFHSRTIYLGAGVACLLAMSIAAERGRPYPDLFEILSVPQQYEGRRVAVFVECRIAQITPDGFFLQQGAVRVLAKTSERDLRVGDFVSVEGIFRAPNLIEVTRMRIAYGRRWKMLVSIAPVIIVAALLRRNLEFDRRAWMFSLKKRPHA